MQLQKEKGWGQDEMALSTSQNNMRNPNKGSGPQRTTIYKGRCAHCGKWGHKKAKCRGWLKLMHEEQGKADKECAEEN